MRRWSGGPSRVFPDDGWIHELPDRHPPGSMALSGARGGRRLTYGQFGGEAGAAVAGPPRPGRGPRDPRGRLPGALGGAGDRLARRAARRRRLRAAGPELSPRAARLDGGRCRRSDRGDDPARSRRACPAVRRKCSSSRSRGRTARPAGPWPRGENAAYLIYTSGSTGRPKGAVNTHEGIRNLLRWIQAEFPLTPARCLLAKDAVQLRCLRAGVFLAASWRAPS